MYEFDSTTLVFSRCSLIRFLVFSETKGPHTFLYHISSLFCLSLLNSVDYFFHVQLSCILLLAGKISILLWSKHHQFWFVRLYVIIYRSCTKPNSNKVERIAKLPKSSTTCDKNKKPVDVKTCILYKKEQGRHLDGPDLGWTSCCKADQDRCR